MVVAAAASHLAASDPGTGDWPMWGGTPDRNMVSSAKGLPSEWDVKTKKNIKWVADLGSQSYGNPVVAGGMVFVGTNNEGLRDPKQPGDRGVLMAFRETDGEFMWQHTHAKLEAGRANDWPYQGVASSPLVDGKTLYYVSNRAVLFAVDIEGFRDKENDGPVTDEKLTGMTDADVIWSFDMMEEVGTYPHNLANSSPTMWGDLIFVSTSNGQDESHVNIPSPRAPSIIAVNKTTGKLVWEDNSVEDRILHGQWSPPSVGTIGGVVQVVSAQGDGWVRGYEAQTGKKLWEFDTNPKEAVWPKTRNELIATPVIVGDRVYLANGQDPEHGEGVGNFYAIDATKRGDITQSGRVVELHENPPLDFHGGGRRRARVHLRLQRIPLLPRRRDRQGAVDARPLCGGVELALRRRRQGVYRRRGRRHDGARARPREKSARGNEHGQLRLRHGDAGPRHDLPQQPQSTVRDREQIARSLRMRWLIFVLGAVLSWGAYGVLLHRGQVVLGNPLKALLCVGVAYFLIGVLVPVGALASQGALSNFNQSGLVTATIAGALGAIGAACIIWAFRAGGLPVYVMPLVFGGAPIVNVLLSMVIHPPKVAPSPLLYVGFVLASVGAGMVLYFRPAA